MTLGYLHLEDGKAFTGELSTPYQSDFRGEVVFTTGMTGYVESLTDPSYAGQILVFTFPLMGNYGVPDVSSWESDHVQVAGVVVSDLCHSWSHSASQRSLAQWLEEQGVPLLSGVDTRALTKCLRDQGVMLGAISHDEEWTKAFDDPNSRDLVAEVSPKEEHSWGVGKKKVILLDCGAKENIVRSLKHFPLSIRRVPFDDDVSGDDFDGLLVSNGPGNPQRSLAAIETVRKVMKREKPIFGICLGAQVMALAAGAQTYKLPYGHRGHNQPCQDLKSGRCYITSQNHGYAVKESTLPEGWDVSFRNLNDGSVEGISHQTQPWHAVQFHPEAAPGPTDTMWFFERFYASL